MTDIDIVLDDFNEHLYKCFAGNKLIEDFNYSQLVTEPTYIRGEFIIQLMKLQKWF